MAKLLQLHTLTFLFAIATSVSLSAQVSPTSNASRSSRSANAVSTPVLSTPDSLSSVIMPDTTDERTRPGNGKISGLLMDSTTKQPVPFAGLALFNLTTGKLVSGTASDDQGRFSLTKLTAGEYRLEISFVGYRTKQIPQIRIERDAEINLGIVKLSSDVRLLKEVEVVGQKNLVEEKADRLIYNAEKDVTVKGGNAADIMRKVPMLAVDLDGNVMLRGSQNVKVLINNKPSAIMAGNVADALKQIPANMIKSVEVITSPSAKYDAEGSAGVINIVMKKDTLQGFSLGLESGLGNRGGSLGLNSSYRTGKMGFSLNGSGWINYNIKGAFHNTQTTGQTVAEQMADTRSHAQFGQYTFGWDYNINQKSTLATSVRFGARNSYANQDHLATRSFLHGELLPFTDVRNVLTSDLSQSVDVNAVYTRTYKPRQEFSFLTLYSRNNRTNNFLADVLDPTDRARVTSRDRNDNPSLNQEITLQADYQTPLRTNQLLEVGSKGIFRQVNSDYFYLRDSSGTGNYFINPLYPANGLIYRQNVIAGYLSYTLTTPNQFTLKAGVRYEYTFLNVHLRKPTSEGSSSDQISTIPGYGNLAPSLTLSKALKGDKMLKLTYNRRLQRPGIQFLNPNPNFANPLNSTQGNPLLGPELTDNFEFSTGTTVKSVYLNASLFARLTRHAIQPVRDTLGALATNGQAEGMPPVIRTTYQNIGKEQAYGINLLANGTLTSKWQIGGGIDLYYAYLTNNGNAGLPNASYNTFNSGLVVAGRLFSGFTLTKGWSIQGFGLLLARQVQVQGYQGGFTFYMLGIKKDFKNKRGSIGLATENFLNHPFKVRTELSSPVLTQHSVTSYYNAGGRITFSYRFGQVNVDKPADRRRKAISNDDVKGGIDKGDKGDGH